MAAKSKDEIYEILRKVIAEELEVEPDSVTPDARFQEDLGADSLDLVELTMKLEDEFGIKVPDEDVEKLTTVQSVVDYIYEKLNEEGTTAA